MVLENMILEIQITDRSHPIRILTITLNQNIVVENGDTKPDATVYFSTLLRDIHYLYRLIARKQTGRKGVKLPQDAIPPGPMPEWVGQSDYCCLFVDRDGQRCIDITLADSRTLVLNNSSVDGMNEIGLLYETLQHYLPR